MKFQNAEYNGAAIRYCAEMMGLTLGPRATRVNGVVVDDHGIGLVAISRADGREFALVVCPQRGRLHVECELSIDDFVAAGGRRADRA